MNIGKLFTDTCEDVAEVKMCETCGKNEAQLPHKCPYQEDVNDVDDDKYCTCCIDCENDCRYSI